jgi:hypothetical protein
MTTRSHAISAIAPPTPGVSALARAIASARDWLRASQRDRTDRLHLLRCLDLDPRFARDIGLTHTEIATRAQRPSWVSETYPNRF